jgi:hypothetical protein
MKCRCEESRGALARRPCLMHLGADSCMARSAMPHARSIGIPARDVSWTPSIDFATDGAQSLHTLVAENSPFLQH